MNIVKCTSIYNLWDNGKLTLKTKIAAYQACVISTLLYRRECWATYAHQERRLNSYHLRSLRRILNVHLSENVTNVEILDRSNYLVSF